MVIDQSQLASDFAKPRMMLNRYWLFDNFVNFFLASQSFDH